MLLRVDDVLALAPTKIVERMLGEIKKQWSLDIKGILVRDGVTSEFKVDSLRFLGCTLELGPKIPYYYIKLTISKNVLGSVAER